MKKFKTTIFFLILMLASFNLYSKTSDISFNKQRYHEEEFVSEFTCILENSEDNFNINLLVVYDKIGNIIDASYSSINGNDNWLSLEKFIFAYPIFVIIVEDNILKFKCSLIL